MKPWEETWHLAWHLDVETFDGPRDNPGPGRKLICERYDHKHGFGSRVLGYIDGPDGGRTRLASAAPELYRALEGAAETMALVLQLQTVEGRISALMAEMEAIANTLRAARGE